MPLTANQPFSGGTMRGKTKGKGMSSAFTDTYIRNLKTVGRYTDAATVGLNLQVKAGGGKYWTFRYLYQSKRHDFSLGTYPAISLREARARATNARNELNQGLRPVATWKPKPAVTGNAGNETRPIFSDFAKSCIDSKKAEWRNDKHGAQWYATIKQYADPVIGHKHLDEIDTDDILRILNPIWHTKTVTASRLRGRIEWVLAAATTRKLRSGMNPAAWRGHLETILPKPNKIKNEQHHKALPYSQLPAFIAKLKEMEGVSPLALEFLILNANRTSEVIGGLRSELNSNDIWLIPKDRMKAHREHRVPLGKRSLELLAIAKSLDPDSDYLFSNNGKPLSNMAMSMLLRRIDYDITVHGFRSCFRDWVAEETLHSPEVAEKALAHTIASKTEKAYRRGDLIEHRKRLMSDWENYCQTGQWGNVVALERKAA
jgi:integrase